jgi:hypothetical protein
MYLLFDISLVALGAVIFWYRERLGRSMVRLQQDQARTWPWLIDVLGRTLLLRVD